MLNPSIRDLRGVTLNHGMVRIITVPRCCLAQQRTKCVRSVSGHRAPRVRRTRRRTVELLTVERRDDRKLRDLAATYAFDVHTKFWFANVPRIEGTDTEAALHGYGLQSYFDVPIREEGQVGKAIIDWVLGTVVG